MTEMVMAARNERRAAPKVAKVPRVKKEAVDEYVAKTNTFIVIDGDGKGKTRVSGKKVRKARARGVGAGLADMNVAKILASEREPGVSKLAGKVRSAAGQLDGKVKEYRLDLIKRLQAETPGSSIDDAVLALLKLKGDREDARRQDRRAAGQNPAAWAEDVLHRRTVQTQRSADVKIKDGVTCISGARCISPKPFAAATRRAACTSR
jgi:hypothetical protein